jgi:hypothetical protein
MPLLSLAVIERSEERGYKVRWIVPHILVCASNQAVGENIESLSLNAVQSMPSEQVREYASATPTRSPLQAYLNEASVASYRHHAIPRVSVRFTWYLCIK